MDLSNCRGALRKATQFTTFILQHKDLPSLACGPKLAYCLVCIAYELRTVSSVIYVCNKDKHACAYMQTPSPTALPTHIIHINKKGESQSASWRESSHLLAHSPKHLQQLGPGPETGSQCRSSEWVVWTNYSSNS